MTKVLSLANKEAIDSFYKTGKFLMGTKFYPSDKKYYWKYECPVCSKDKYVELGLCSGIFEASKGNLKKGKRSCRCSVKYNWNQEMQELRCKELIEAKGGSWGKWKSEYKNSHSKIIFTCAEHGLQYTTPNKLLQGRYCPKCSNQESQNQLYFVEIFLNNTLVGYKYGITCNFESRLKFLNGKFKHKLINLWYFDNTEDCKKEEEMLKSLFSPSDNLDFLYYGEGYTETLKPYLRNKVINYMDKSMKFSKKF